MISTELEMLPAQAAASATALRERRGTEEEEGPECVDILREVSSLFLDRACGVVAERGGVEEAVRERRKEGGGG